MVQHMLSETAIALAPQFDAWLGSILLMLMKITILLFAALILVKFWRSASASTRHLILNTCLIGTVMLPIAAVLMPNTYVNFPSITPEVKRSLPSVPDSVSGSKLPVGSALWSDVMARDLALKPELPKYLDGRSTVPNQQQPSFGYTDPLIAGAPAAVSMYFPASDELEISSAGDTSLTAQSGLIVPRVCLLALYAFGAVIALSRILLGLFRANRFVNRSFSPDDDRLETEIQHTAQKLQLNTPVRLRLTDEVRVPFVAGFANPTVVLPFSALDWPVERVRSVLLHELAHLWRLDHVTVVLNQIIAAIFWFHPLVWWTERRIRQECESACDDLVLNTGLLASSYAEHLISVARTLLVSDRVESVTLALGRRSSLERRVLQVLNPTRARGRLTRKQLVGAVMVTLALLFPLSSVKLQARSGPIDDEETIPPDEVVDLGEELEISIESRSLGRNRASAFSDELPVAMALSKSPNVCAAAPATPTVPFIPAIPPVPVDPVTPFDFEILLSPPATPALAPAPLPALPEWSFDQGFDREALEDHVEAQVRAQVEAEMKQLGQQPGWTFSLATPDFDFDLDSFADAVDSGRLESLRELAELNKQEFEAVREALNAARIAQTETTTARAWFDAGYAYFRSGQYERAIEAFSKVLDTRYLSTIAKYNIACAYARIGQLDTSLTWLEQAVDDGLDDAEAVRNDPDLASLKEHVRFKTLLAQMESNRGDDNDDDDDDDDGDVKSHQVQEHEKSGHQKSDKGSDKNDRTNDAGEKAYEEAYAKHNDGQFVDAIAGFENAASLGYKVGTSYYNIACGYAQLGKKDDALKWLKSAYENGFSDTNILFSDSDLDPLRGDPPFREWAASIDKNGAKRGRQDRWTQANQGLERLKASDNTDSRQWKEIGNQLLQLRELDNAIIALSKAVEYDLDHGDVPMYNLACAYALNQQSGEALEWLGRSIEAGFDSSEHIRSDSDLVSLRGSAGWQTLLDRADFYSLDRFQDNKHVKTDSNYSEKRWSPAVQEFSAYVQIHPQSGFAWFNLGWSLHFSRQHDKAVEAFKRAAELGHRPATSTYNVACAYAMQHKTEEALAALDKAIKINPSLLHNLSHDDDLKSLSADPRFKAYKKQAKSNGKHLN